VLFYDGEKTEREYGLEKRIEFVCIVLKFELLSCCLSSFPVISFTFPPSSFCFSFGIVYFFASFSRSFYELVFLCPPRILRNFAVALCCVLSISTVDTYRCFWRGTGDGAVLL